MRTSWLTIALVWDCERLRHHRRKRCPGVRHGAGRQHRRGQCDAAYGRCGRHLRACRHRNTRSLRIRQLGFVSQRDGDNARRFQR